MLKWRAGLRACEGGLKGTGRDSDHDCYDMIQDSGNSA